MFDRNNKLILSFLHFSLKLPIFVLQIKKWYIDLIFNMSDYLTKMTVLKLSLFSISRTRKLESRYHEKMGFLHTWVTYIKKSFLGIPVKTIHKYRETYFGQIKDCKDCELSKMTADV